MSKLIQAGLVNDENPKRKSLLTEEKLDDTAISSISSEELARVTENVNSVLQ